MVVKATLPLEIQIDARVKEDGSVTGIGTLATGKDCFGQDLPPLRVEVHLSPDLLKDGSSEKERTKVLTTVVQEAIERDLREACGLATHHDLFRKHTR